MMVETWPAGCGVFGLGLFVWFWVVLVALVLFSTIRLFFPSFNERSPCPHGVRTRGKKNSCWSK